MARMDASGHDRRFIVRALSVAVVCGVLAAGANALQPVGKPQPQAAAKQKSPAAGQRTSGQPAPILVAPGPGGVVIASQDTQALDQFERLLTALAAGLAAEEPELTIFYLKHAKADVIAETLDAILSGRSVSSVRITAEPRLNALIVQASRSDADAIEGLLKILDQKQSPQEILAQAKPRIIAVSNASAQDIAGVIRQVYQDRMTGGSGRGPGQAPGPIQGPFQGLPQGPFQGPPGAPQEFFQQMAMLGGGMGGPGGPQRASAEELPKMSLGVDARTNSLVVAAPDPLFREVKDLVGQLDRAALRSKQTVQVMALRGTDTGLLRQALPALMGDRVRMGQTSLAASRFGAAGVQPQAPLAPGQRLSGMAAQTGVFPGEPRLTGLPPSPMANQGTAVSPPGPAPAAPTQGPFGDQGMPVGPGGPAEAGPPQGPLPPPWPDGGPGPMGGQNLMMEGGPSGQSPVFQGGGGTRPGAGPGWLPSAGPARP